MKNEDPHLLLPYGDPMIYHPWGVPPPPPGAYGHTHGYPPPPPPPPHMTGLAGLEPVKQEVHVEFFALFLFLSSFSNAILRVFFSFSLSYSP